MFLQIVVTILIANVPGLKALAFKSAFDGSGISTYAYTPPSVTTFTWPTLSSLIQANKRLIVFLSSEADAAVASYLLPEFQYIFETPFTVTDASEFNCTIDRPNNVLLSSALSGGMLPLMNHFLDSNMWVSLLQYLLCSNALNSST